MYVILVMNPLLKVILRLFCLFLIFLTGCVPVTANPELSTDSSWIEVTPAGTNPGRTSPTLEDEPELVNTCQSPPTHLPDSPIDFLVETDEEGTVTYCIHLNSADYPKGVAPDLLIHLPETMQSAQVTGAGWSCERLSAVQDEILDGTHIDDLCRNVTAQERYPGLIRIVVPAESVRVDDRICIQALVKEQIELACIPTEPHG